MKAVDPSAMHREVTITRTFDAPRELVFRAWTDPAQMTRWWGPKGFSNPVCEMDVRVGGSMRIVMRGPGGQEHPMTGEFREVVAPERLVFMAVARDAQDNPLLESLTTVTFQDVAGKTRLTMHAVARGIVPIAPHMLAGMQAGWGQSLEQRLADLVSPNRGDVSERELVTSRVFHHPRELVFEAWTDPVHLARWWGPKGFRNTVHECSVKPGGYWRFIMHGPNGVDYDNEILFLEILRPEKIVCQHTDVPRFELTALFEDLGGKTRLTTHQRFETKDECDRVRVFAAPANQENFDRLEAELAGM